MLRCGLLGQSLPHSYSPRIHHALGDYAYQLFELPPTALDDFLQNGPFDALNVTIPYKTAVLPHCAALSDTARAIGSVNTLLRRPDGTLFGDNTDAYGFTRLLEESGFAVTGKKILVLGSGGASLTVCHVLQKARARKIVVISRNGPENYETLEKHADADFLVNTTPVGMYPGNGKATLNLERLPACRGVLDLIYNPARTALLLQAEALGIPAFGGLSMLVHQAKAAAELFTGHAILEEKVARILRDLRVEMENIILIGMPGAGKSTLGRVLAQQLGRDFVDADSCVEEWAGCSIPTLFEQEGEGGFRKRETAVLRELGRGTGQILATGGGCVTREENHPLLHQNGKLVFLERDPTLLERAGRPLSQAADLTALYEARLPLYRRFADVSVQNDAPAEQVAARIWEALYEIFDP